MQQDVVATMPLGSHDGSSYLAQSHAMSPTGSLQAETLGTTLRIAVGLLHHKRRTIEMRR